MWKGVLAYIKMECTPQTASRLCKSQCVRQINLFVPAISQCFVRPQNVQYCVFMIEYRNKQQDSACSVARSTALCTLGYYISFHVCLHIRSSFAHILFIYFFFSFRQAKTLANRGLASEFSCSGLTVSDIPNGDKIHTNTNTKQLKWSNQVPPCCGSIPTNKTSKNSLQEGLTIMALKVNFA